MTLAISLERAGPGKKGGELSISEQQETRNRRHRKAFVWSARHGPWWHPRLPPLPCVSGRRGGRRHGADPRQEGSAFI